MRTRTWTAACAAITFGLVVGVAAQTSPSASSASAQRSASASAANKVMVTGCVERATPSPTGTTGTKSGTSSDFVLQHAMMSSSTGSSSAYPSSGTSSSTSTSSSSTSSTRGTAGTTGTSGTSSSAEKEYKLDATSAQLASHIGHKVEITGELEQPGASASARTNPPSASASASSVAPGQARLKVDSVRMISTTCS